MSKSQTTKSYWLFGTRQTILADSDITGGRYDFAEGQFPAGMRTPLHRHNGYQEQLYVLDGEFTVWIGQRAVVLHAGESLVIPVGAAHSVGATGDGPARGLVIASPSGFARLIRAVGAPDIADSPPPSPDSFDHALFQRISAELGDEILR